MREFCWTHMHVFLRVTQSTLPLEHAQPFTFLCLHVRACNACKFSKLTLQFPL